MDDFTARFFAARQVSEPGSYQVLAAAVLKFALSDATGYGACVPLHIRRAARRWLVEPDNPERRFWTALAGLDDRLFVECAKRVLSAPCTTNARPSWFTWQDADAPVALNC